jgi:hypothetical protein
MEKRKGKSKEAVKPSAFAFTLYLQRQSLIRFFAYKGRHVQIIRARRACNGTLL